MDLEKGLSSWKGFTALGMNRPYWSAHHFLRLVSTLVNTLRMPVLSVKVCSHITVFLFHMHHVIERNILQISMNVKTTMEAVNITAIIRSLAMCVTAIQDMNYVMMDLLAMASFNCLANYRK